MAIILEIHYHLNIPFVNLQAKRKRKKSSAENN